MKWMIYDIESYINFFYVAFYDIVDKQIHEFEISTRKNEFNELFKFYNEHRYDMFIGFNNLKYDSPVLSYVVNIGPSPDAIYEYSQDIIHSDEYVRPLFINEIDLHRLHHFNNPARTTSLKTLQSRMGLSIKDLPYKHYTVLEPHEMDDVIDYCKNSDIPSTYKFYQVSRDLIKQRLQTQKEFGIKCISLPDASVGEKIVLKYINEHGGEIMDKISYSSIPVKEVIFNYIQFQTEEYQLILNWFKKQTWKNNNLSLSHKVKSGITYELGMGGLHASRKGIFYNLVDIDATSYYPNIIIRNNISPYQYGDNFIKAYSKIYDLRVAAKKQGNKVTDAALKLSLNAVFGKLKDEWSPLYDTKALLSVTINGQLMLLMLAEMLELAGNKIIQCNTDGITIQGDNYDNAIKEWEFITKIPLEIEYYKMMAIRDVNNYIAYNGKTSKEKGAYDVDKSIKGQKQWYKDDSASIIPLAVREYFINNVSIEETITNCQDSYMFLITKRLKSGKKGIPVFIHQQVVNGEVVEKTLGKTIRYYICKKPSAIFKRYSDGSLISLNGKQNQYPAIDSIDIDMSNINYSYYIKEARKLIYDIEDVSQLSIF